MQVTKINSEVDKCYFYACCGYLSYLKDHLNLYAICGCLYKLPASQKCHIVRNVTCKPLSSRAESTHRTHYMKIFHFSDLVH